MVSREKLKTNPLFFLGTCFGVQLFGFDYISLSASSFHWSLSRSKTWLWCVVMEMHVIDRLAISLERLYAAVPSVLLNLYQVTWVRLETVTLTVCLS